MNDNGNMSMSSQSFVEENYTIALNFFMNKNFSKSFDILKVQFKTIFKNVQSGVISEPIFVKVLSLYLTEVGLMLQSQHDFHISKQEKQQIIQQLEDDFVLTNLAQIYHDVNEVPSELLYNLYLIDYIGLELPTVHKKLVSVYSKLSFDSSDKQLKKLVGLLAIKVLPELELYGDARQLISENPLLKDKQRYLDQISKVEKEKADEKDNKEQAKQRHIREQRQREEQNKLEKDLKYKSLKQIREQQPSKEISKSTSPAGTDLNTLKDKLLYNLKFSKNWLKEHSPVILLVIVLLFISNKFFKARNINVGQNLKETLKMAFKISYL